ADTDTDAWVDSGADSGLHTGLDTDTGEPCIDYSEAVADCAASVEPGTGGGDTWSSIDPDSSTLLDDLHRLVDDHDPVSYDGLWEAFRETDARDDGRVWDVYADPGDGSAAYTYSFGTDQCGEYDSEGDCYNREHVFPQSWSDDVSPMKTDLHQVFPVDGYVNNLRGSRPFAPVRGGSATSNGSLRGRSQHCDFGGDAFEPVDAFKGDLARAILYMSVRYRGDDDGWSTSSANDGASLEPWFEQVLVAWHIGDPVSDKERERNDEVEDEQGNRNPFVDRPELVCSIADF
ncbi:MAG: hypothetical protein GY884_25325, partial [Proteobacteria bacterium]|nr:hypothetical protein [Pseudomonadota bacterium]